MTVVVFTVSLLGAMALGMPIAFALLVCGVALMVSQGQIDTTILSQKLIEGADSFPLLAIPFFMLAGELMNAGGISQRIVNFALAWVGHIRGGLGFVAIFAAVMMAAISGSAAADTAALGALLIPMMRQAGYDVPRAAGPDRRRRRHRAGDSAVDRTDRVRRHRQRVDRQAVPGRHLPRPDDGPVAGDRLAVGGAAATRSRCCRASRWRARVRAGDRRHLGAADAARHHRRPEVRRLHAHRGRRRGLRLRLRGRRVRLPRAARCASSTALLVSAAKSTAVVVFLIAAALVSAWLITTSDVAGAGRRRCCSPSWTTRSLLMLVIMVLVVIVGTALDFAPDAADPHAGADAGDQAGRHRPGVLRRAVHHEQRHRPDHAAGGHRAQRGVRRGQDLDERADEGPVALPDGPS